MKNTTKYYRVVKENNYSVISNEFIRRKDLSWKAKGILTYILTLPDDWKINLNEIMTHSTDGERSFRSGWKELEVTGYIKRYPVRDGQRIKHWETIIRESVDIEPSSLLCGFVDVQDVDVQNVDVQNVELLSTNNNQVLKEQSTNKPSSATLKDDFEKLWSLYPKKMGSKKRAFASYEKAIKSGTTNKEIQDGIVAYKKMIKRDGTEMQFVAYGDKWFTNERWTNDYGLSITKKEETISFEEKLRRSGVDI